MSGKELPPHVKDMMFSQGAVIVFGPTYMDTVRKMEQYFGDQVVLSCERIDDLAIPETLVLSCFMVFGHYLPRCKGRSVTNDDFAAWRDEFLEGISFGADAPLDTVPEEYASQEPVEIGFDGGATNNEIILFVSWGPVESGHCVNVARSLERSYLKHGGYYPADKDLN